MPSEHIIKSYDEELNRLNGMIVEMGGLAESQLAAAIVIGKAASDLLLKSHYLPRIALVAFRNRASAFWVSAPSM